MAITAAQVKELREMTLFVSFLSAGAALKSKTGIFFTPLSLKNIFIQFIMDWKSQQLLIWFFMHFLFIFCIRHFPVSCLNSSTVC